MHVRHTRISTLFYDTQVNFLAHVYLARGVPDAIVGQLCGDFVRGKDLAHFPPAIAQGIRVHRAVDSYTDRHPLNLQARELFASPHRRFAGIITDVVYDHYLALEWDNYSDVSLEEYETTVKVALQARYALLPPRLQRFTEFLQTENILQNNLYQAKIELTLQRLSARRASMKPLATASSSLWQNNDQLKGLFDQFFPELISQTIEIQNRITEQQIATGALDDD